MIKKALLPVLYFSYLTMVSQTGWNLLKSNWKYNYAINNSNKINVSIYTDSVKNTSGDSIYYFNTILAKCDTCINSHLANNPFDSTYILNGLPHFLQRKGIATDTSFYFYDTASFVIYPSVPTGHTWLFDSSANIQATVLSTQLIPFLGINDSVKHILLSTADTIIYSKQYGILQFPLLNLQHDYYYLVGIEGASIGKQTKKFHDFFDFNIGDIFQYETQNNNYNFLPPLFNQGAKKVNILSKTWYTDSVVYLVNVSEKDSSWLGGGAVAVYYYNYTTTLTYIDSARHMANLYPSEKTILNTYFANNSLPEIINQIQISHDSLNFQEKKFGFGCYTDSMAYGTAARVDGYQNLYDAGNAPSSVGMKLTEGLGYTASYINNYDEINSQCMIGYIKNGVIKGIVYDSGFYTSVATNSYSQKIEVYPNPASNNLFISNFSGNNISFTLYSTVGYKIMNLSLQNNEIRKIDIENLPNGVYFLSTDSKTEYLNKKIIIAH